MNFVKKKTNNTVKKMQRLTVALSSALILACPSVAVFAASEDAMYKSVTNLICKFATAGGALWCLFGAVILGVALKDKNGPDIKTGSWQVIGGVMVIAAAQLFKNLSL